MKKHLFFLIAFCCLSTVIKAQVPGDTIVVNTFNYTQTYGTGIRDTMINFPNLPGVTYEKIYMLYNMRCKNGVVGNLVPPTGKNGCGEWDYSCNTYITDSSKVDSAKTKGPSHVISGFSGSTYNYTSIPTYTYYQYNQQQVINTTTLSETSALIGAGTSTTNLALHTQLQNGKSYFVYTAAELAAAGLVAGNISSIKLNVLNTGSGAQFFKIKMKHTSQSILDARFPETTGFTEVYFFNTNFTLGLNQLNFYNNFNWNGTDNILIEMSFSNPNAGTDIILASDVNASNLGLITNSNDYHFEFNGANKINMGNAKFNTISNQMSISFWANGNSNYLPTNTSILEATNNAGTRQVNIHFPWSNSTFYWDCGNASAGYDRINLLATSAEIASNWNHWTFTKNTTTGVMNIYKNGNLWHTGTGKTIPIEVTNMVLGMNGGANYLYYGKIDELSIWNTELTATEIQNWMNKSITNAHPQYASLQAYYPFNEGAGNVCNDNSTAPSNGTIIGNQLWSLLKGKDIFKNFEETNNRPQVSFVQGTYTQTITSTTILDSVLNNKNTVTTYAVTNNNYSVASTNEYFKAGYTYVYDGDSGLLLDSILVPAQNTINITSLNYMTKSPSRFQIMSFVTPYGNGLDLGINGKTYTFDVTDYAPILKGMKRMTMDAGGQWQEDMDIKFLFIVGTPPATIKDINNLWKVESVGYTSILNDDKFESRDVMMDASATAFKIKTAITGHGQEGEFIPQNHFININGGNKEFAWDVWKECGTNPVYPQGGTWIYDRAGWCPGMSTDTKESYITSYITPGSVANIDYGLLTATGSSNYWVSNQLVTYGAPNFTLDACVVDIKNPSNKIEYARTNSICKNPTIIIKNTGSNVLTSLTIDYWINNNTTKESYNWTGNLAFLETAEVVLPTGSSLWNSLNGPNNNVFHVEIKNPNNGTDAYSLNNKMSTPFKITNVVPANFVLWTKTNLFANETSYKIIDENNNTILSRTNLVNNTNYRDTLKLGFGCYQLIIEDTDGDGLSFWANNDGAGFARLRTLTNSTIINFQGDFGKSLIYNFTVDFPLSYNEINNYNEIAVYPNPASKQFVVEGKNMFTSSINVYNQLGQVVFVPSTIENNKIKFDSSNLPSGLYFVVFNDINGSTQTKKIQIEN